MSAHVRSIERGLEDELGRPSSNAELIAELNTLYPGFGEVVKTSEKFDVGVTKPQGGSDALERFTIEE